jgi:hypothetical protein
MSSIGSISGRGADGAGKFLIAGFQSVFADLGVGMALYGVRCPIGVDPTLLGV